VDEYAEYPAYISVKRAARIEKQIPCPELAIRLHSDLLIIPAIVKYAQYMEIRAAVKIDP
jgi:hypothetical protein